MKERAKTLLQHLSFDECLELFNKLPAGNPIIDLVFERMEELDPVKFEKFLDYDM